MGDPPFDPGLLRELLGEPRAADRPVHVFESIDSTSSELARRLRHGAPAGTAIVAAAQTRGRGRCGREWSSPPGGNLYLSLAVRVPPPEAEHLTAIPLAAGVAAADALASAGLDGALLKWPNDLLVRGRKIGGILCETADPRARPLLAVVGIGLNLSAAPLGAGLERAAISAPEVAGGPLPPEAVAASFVSGLERLLDGLPALGWSGLAELWKARAEPFGRRVTAGPIEGATVDLDGRGRLLVRLDDGTVSAVAAGIVADAGE